MHVSQVSGDCAACNLNLGVLLRLLLAQMHSTYQRQHLDADCLVPHHPLHASSSVWLSLRHEEQKEQVTEVI